MGGEWPTVPLSAVIEENRRITYGIVQPGAHDPDGVPILRVSDFRDGRLRVANPLKVAHSVANQFPRTRLNGGELLLTLVGTVGEMAIVPRELAGWNLARAVGLIPVRQDVGAYWVRLAMQAPEVRERILGRVNTTVQTTLNLADVAELPIVLPPERERTNIAELLGALDDKIGLNRRMAETLEATTRALFKSWFVDFDPVRAKVEGRLTGLPDALDAYFPDHVTDDGLPEGWEMAPLLEFFDLVSGGTPKTSVQHYWGGNIPWFSVVDAPDSGMYVLETERTLSSDGLANCAATLLPENATIITARGTVGKLGLVGRQMAINQSCYAAISKNGFGPFFVYFLVKSGIDALRAQTHGSVFDTITRSTFAGVTAPKPPTGLAAAYEAIAAPLLARVKAAAEQSDTLAALRDTLLPKLISGALRIRDADREVAAA